MSENNANDDLETILGEMEKPNLSNTISGLGDDHLAEVLDTALKEANRRSPPNLGNLNDAEFAALKRFHGF